MAAEGVGDGDMATVEYRIARGGHDEMVANGAWLAGAEIESSAARRQPLTFEVGSKMVLPVLDHAVRRLALGVDYGRGREVALPALHGERPPNICLFGVHGECEEEEDSRLEPCQWFGGVRFGFELCKRGRRLRLASRAGRTGPPHSFHSAGRWQWGERREVAAQEGSEVGVGEAARRAEELVQVVPGKGPNEAGQMQWEITGDYGRRLREITG
jgi:hypothetical protein